MLVFPACVYDILSHYWSIIAQVLTWSVALRVVEESLSYDKVGVGSSFQHLLHGLTDEVRGIMRMFLEKVLVSKVDDELQV